MMNRKDNLMAIYHHQSHDHIASFFDIASVGGDAEEFENGPAGGALWIEVTGGTQLDGSIRSDSVSSCW